MKPDVILNRDCIDIILNGEKEKDLAEIKIYHWKLLREYNISIMELLKIAFSDERYSV